VAVSPRGARRASDLDRVDAALDVLVGALDRQIERFRIGAVRSEEDLTSALVATAAEALHNVVTFGVRWDATVLTRRSEEPRHGADLLFALDLELETYQVAKGFLTQAKCLPETRKAVADRAKLIEQCETMLRWTNAAYVWTYARRDRLRAYPAVSVVAADGRLDDLSYLPLRDFFSDHFNCFIGDRGLGYRDTDTLEGVRREYRVGSAVLVRARADGFDEQ
jgi:hypothetical protein